MCMCSGMKCVNKPLNKSENIEDTGKSTESFQKFSKGGLHIANAHKIKHKF